MSRYGPLQHSLRVISLRRKKLNSICQRPVFAVRILAMIHAVIIHAKNRRRFPLAARQKPRSRRHAVYRANRMKKMMVLAVPNRPTALLVAISDDQKKSYSL